MAKYPFICGNLFTFASKIQIRKRMKRNIVPFLMMVATLVFASCLKSNDTETTYYSDTAISSFTLGTLNRYVTTKAKDGVTDSTYKTTVAGSKYDFYIDHVNRKIYNLDSLPYGTDASKVLVTVTAKNSGQVFIKSLTGDTLRSFSNTDSLDFSKPRELRVYPYSNSSNDYRAYEVTVNVHKEPTDSVYWALEKGVKPESLDLPVVGVNQYKVENGQLLMSADKGATWTVEKLDTDASYLPNDNINFVWKGVPANDLTDYVLLVGTSDADKKYASCWFKYDEYAEGSVSNGWSYITTASSNVYPLPKMKNLSVAFYGDHDILAIGGAGMDECTVEAYEAMYVSHDNGISWIPNDVFRLPNGMDKKATNVKLLVDAKKELWLFCEGTDEVWHGRLNRDDKSANKRFLE